MSPATPELFFQSRLSSDPGGPLVTYYDDNTGERAELSAKSLANWIAKTHFFLLDQCGLSLSAKAYVQLPGHWLALPIIIGSWFAGLELTDNSSVADIAFVADSDADEFLTRPSPPPEVVVVSMLSMARPGQPPPGCLDYASAVRPMPDAWATVRAQAGPSDLAAPGRSRAEIAGDLQRWASEQNLPANARVLTRSSWLDLACMLSSLIGPLAVGGSMVLARNVSDERRRAIVESERAIDLVGRA